MENQTITTSRPHDVGAEKPTIETFVAALNAGSDSWQKAGEVLVSLRREDENVFAKIVHDYSFVTQDILDVFFQIGIRTLYPLALLLPRHVFSAVRQMRYDAQIKVMSEPIEIVTRCVGDKPVVIRKGVAKLTGDEVKRALWKKGCRSVSKQVEALTTPATISNHAPVNLENKPRLPVEVVRFAVSRGPAGTWRFEKTLARNHTEQRVLIHEGQAIVVLTEYPKE